MSRLLFILKQRDVYGEDLAYHNLNSGLRNSAQYVVDMLNGAGVEAKVAQVVDNNGIDREVAAYRPTHVVIEALWVVPDKFFVLERLHPDVQWIVRIHSEIPFLAMEGIAMDWIARYLAHSNVSVALNSDRTTADFKALVPASLSGKLIYLPNYYPVAAAPKRRRDDSGVIDIGCYGAVRPLKNHLTQAVAAIQFAQCKGLRLNFHVNAGRMEQKGDAALRNLRGLFAGYQGAHQLVEHPWMEIDEFLQVIARMDINMQVSFTESFNIVAADSAVNNVPVVGSPDIRWLGNAYQADPTSVDDIVGKLSYAWRWAWLNRHRVNRNNLAAFCADSKSIWLAAFGDPKPSLFARMKAGLGLQ